MPPHIWVEVVESKPLGVDVCGSDEIPLNRVIEMVARKAPLYGLSTSFVNPRGTASSEENTIT